MEAVVSLLSTARDDIRRQYLRSTVVASDEQRFDNELADAMTTFGNASTVLNCLLMPAKANFLHVSATPHCPRCGMARRMQTSIAALPVPVTISTSALRRGKPTVIHTLRNRRTS
jgi:hypothetical protein